MRTIPECKAAEVAKEDDEVSTAEASTSSSSSSSSSSSPTSSSRGTKRSIKELEEAAAKATRDASVDCLGDYWEWVLEKHPDKTAQEVLQDMQNRGGHHGSIARPKPFGINDQLLQLLRQKKQRKEEEDKGEGSGQRTGATGKGPAPKRRVRGKSCPLVAA